MKQWILDASVGAKWIFEEEMSDKAGWFLEQIHQKEIEGIVPEFFFSEISNVCWVKVRKNIASIDYAMDALDKIFSFPLLACSDKELSDVALENALRFKISAYDGLYLALAEVYVAPLVTADETLFNVCHKRFEFIEFLGDIKKP